MYTLEHFQAVREVLEPGGSFCQWLPLYQLSQSELATIAATFCEAFPSVEVFWLYLNVEQPAIGLVGSRKPLAVDLASLAEAMRRAERRELLARNGLAEPASLIGLWIAGRERLATWAAGAPLERRSRPRVEFLAPRHRFGAARPPQDTNTLLMLELAQPLAECGFLAGAGSAAMGDLARHRDAVQHFMRGRHALALRGDPRRGIAELRRAIELTPEWDWIAWNLEQACAAAFEAGELELLDEAAVALSVSPAHGHVGLYWNARASAARGELEGARRLLERSLELEPGFEPSEDLLRQLERKP